MKVLVTGANGFLGHWLCKHLTDQGHEVFALVRKNSDTSELDPVPCKKVYGDVTDSESLKQTFKGVDSVFHLAGVIAYKPSERALMEKVNVQGTQNVIEAVKSEGVRRLVHLSSVVAVGAGFNPSQILNEDSVYNLSHLNLGYFETKRAAEELVIQAVREDHIDAVMLNPSTIYGPGDAKKGSRKTQVQVARGEFKFYTSGGVNVVDVEDVVQGITLGWEKGKSGERYILCSENLTIHDLFSRIALLGGVPAPKIKFPDWALHSVGFVGDQLSKLGVKSSVSSENAWTATLFHWFESTKAQKELGFKPRPAQESLEKSLRWMRDHGYLD